MESLQLISISYVKTNQRKNIVTCTQLNLENDVLEDKTKINLFVARTNVACMVSTN